MVVAELNAKTMEHHFAIVHKDKESAYGVVFPDLREKIAS